MIEVSDHIKSRMSDYGKLRLTIKSKDGLVKEIKEQPIDSYVSNYWHLLYAQCFQVGILYIPGMFGGSVEVNGNRPYNFMAEQSVYGSIIVGSGTTPVAIDDTDLDTRILNGSAAGELSYQQPTYTLDTTGIYSLRIYREFVNNSGSSIDIKEVGLGATSEYGTFLAVRDVLSQTYSLAAGDYVTVEYILGLVEGLSNWRKRVLYTFTGDDTSNTAADGTVINFLNTPANVGCFIAGAGIYSSIAVGRGNTAVAQSDIDLIDKIVHGNNSGQLSYSDTNTSSFNQDLATDSIEFDISRIVTNHSNGSIDVAEIGLFTNAENSVSQQDNTQDEHYLQFRKVLPSPVTIGPGASRPLKWTFKYSL